MSENFVGFTQNALTVTRRMHEEAKELSSAFVGAVHVFLGLLTVKEGRAYKVLLELLEQQEKITELELSARSRLMAVEPGVGMSTITLALQVNKVILYAREEAKHLNHAHVGTEHLLLGLLRLSNGLITSMVLEHAGVTLYEAQRALQKVLSRELSEGTVESS